MKVHDTIVKVQYQEGGEFKIFSAASHRKVYEHMCTLATVHTHIQHTNTTAYPTKYTQKTFESDVVVFTIFPRN